MTYKSPPSCQITKLDEILEYYFPSSCKDVRLFIDVGAYDGYEWSNTWTLAEQGWIGICIEPLPILADRCKQSHYSATHAVITLQIACGEADGDIELHTVSQDAPLATSNPEVAATKLWGDSYTGTLVCKCMTLNTVLSTMTNIPVSLISIDVEGSEIAVLKGLDINRWQPKMVIVEVHEKHTDQRRAFQAKWINEYFQAAGYTKIYSDAINNIYVRPE